jgi:hypothetical protein
MLMSLTVLQACSGEQPTASEPANGVGVPVVWAAVAPGANMDFSPFTCGLTVTGTPYCWGAAPTGQTAATAPREPRAEPGDGRRPFPVAGGLVFQQITGGGEQVCGLTAAGVAHCWHEPGGTPDHRRLPVAIAAPRPFRMINAGSNGISCGVTDEGAALCWSLRDSAVAVPVPGGVRFRTLALGGPFHFACGIALDGAAYCWGANEVGQLGLGPAETGAGNWQTTPQRVLGGHRFVVLSAGEDHACGVTDAFATYCWGSGNFGQLGAGQGVFPPTVLLSVAGGLRFVSVSAAADHSCGLTNDGAAYCWGRNDKGQLGNGPEIEFSRFVPVPVSGGLRFASLTARANHTCGVTAAGEAYCWGENSVGQVGDGARPGPSRWTDIRRVPTRVANPRM